MPPAGFYDSNATTVWVTWTTTNTSGTTDTTWPFWLQDTTSMTGNAVTVWQQWSGTGIDFRPTALTPEERERQRVEAEERKRVQEEAKARARELLLAVLDRKQRRELDAEGHFHVQTKDGERIYRLKPGSPPQRIKGEDGSRYSYCIHPTQSYPHDDVVAALKLMIEADEEAFLRTANATFQGRVLEAA